MPFKNFTPSELLASDVNTYLMKQTVMTFDDATARATALTLPVEGMVTFLKDSDTLWVYNGTAWIELARTSSSGLIQIVPTVSGAGVTVSSKGVVTLSSASNAVINNCFPTQFNNFQVVFSDMTRPTAGSVTQLNFCLRTASATVTTNYRSGGTYGTYTGVYGNIGSTINRFNVGDIGNLAKTNTVINVFNPNLPVITGYSALVSNYDAWFSVAGQNTNTVAYSNCEVFAASPISGSISFFGYNQ